MGSKVIIIAEAGVNHNGSLAIAKQMVDAAADAGADYIKFQTFTPNLLVSKIAEQADYQINNTGKIESQLDMLSRLALKDSDFAELEKYCRIRSIGFLSSPFDLYAIDFLESLDMDFWKIPSGEITNYPYLVKIAKSGRPVILSTGMSTIDDIKGAVEVLTANGLTKSHIYLLHCNTQYPTPYSDVNLAAMATLRKEFDIPVGYSDHTLGIEVPIAAVALGAAVIEKHFTLNRGMQGPDHKASLEPAELKMMISSIRHISEAIGSAEKIVTESEHKNMIAARKSITAIRPIAEGEILTEENLCTKRPGNGISPMMWPKVLGTRAIRDFDTDELIEL